MEAVKLPSYMHVFEELANFALKATQKFSVLSTISSASDGHARLHSTTEDA
jgi:hypothetical protein